MAFIGVDLHTNSFTICRLEADGSEAFQTFHLSAQAIEQFCQGLDAKDELAIETTGNTAWFCDEVRSSCRPDRGGQSAPVQGDPDFSEKDRPQ